MSEEQEMMMNNISIPNNSSEESDSGQPAMLLRFILETVICMPMSLLGLVGNALAVMVLLGQRPRLTTSVHLMALAVADCLVLISTILLRSIRYYYYYKQELDSYYMTSYPYIFLALYPSVYFIRLVGTWFVILLTVDRYIAVCHPFRAQSSCTVSKARRNIIIILITAALFSLPRYFEHQLDLANQFKFTQTELTKSKLYTVIYRVFLYLFVMYVFPMCILCVLNAKLLTALRKAEVQRHEISGTPSNHSSQGRSVTAIVVTVVTLSIASNSVAVTSHLLWSLPRCFESMEYLEVPRRYISLVSNVLVTFNSTINFLIYVFCSRSFRSIFVRTCCHKKCYAGYASINGSVTRMGTVRSEVSGAGNRRKELTLLSNKPSPVML